MTRTSPHDPDGGPAAGVPDHVYVYTAGFFRDARLRRIMRLAGARPRLGWPGAHDRVAVWGAGPRAWRGARVAGKSGAAILHVEDAFLRSLLPGRAKDPTLGLVLDRSGLYFDANVPSDLETLLATHPFDDADLLTRARDGIDRMRSAHLSKYAATLPDAPVPQAGYVLVIDQTRGDASIRLGRATQAHFKEMLFCARQDHPKARIVIKTHPETSRGLRPGHFGPDDLDARTSIYDGPASPHALMEGAVAVYTVTSQMGFEAILCGHVPKVFGQPFYAGWGLSDDISPHERRHRRLTRTQLFAGAMLLYPIWYDPYHDRLGRFEDALGALEAEARAWREDRTGWQAQGMRLWKRGHLRRFFGRHGRIGFGDSAGPASSGPAPRHMVWAGKAAPDDKDSVRVEDGFLRSRGLGAELVPPLSLVLDPDGIYYDPGRPSRLESLIRARRELTPGQARRATALCDRLIAARLSKYNLSAPAIPDLPPGHRILVPGQVEDDASIRTGAGKVNTNAALLRAVRSAHPDAVVIYKPHPDVEAGLRPGHVTPAILAEIGALPVAKCDPVSMIEVCDEVWTMTSLLGFEALLRGTPVTCVGTPFYAGWGLTRDLGRIPPRRRLHVPLESLIHAALVDYPRYFDPVSGLACPVEVAMDRLCEKSRIKTGWRIRLLAKAQGALASQSWLWR